jgi:hypothetical protein
MYFNGRIDVDPSQLTLIKRVKPTKVFEKLLDALSFGQKSDKQEHETFTALSILQQLSVGLRTMDVKNIIRLAIDDYDFYADSEGVEDDLSQAMFELKAKIDPIESEVFKTIYLVLEHHQTPLKYLIEIAVKRKHSVGEYPLTFHVNAVFESFKLQPGETREQLENRMRSIFASQEKYDQYINLGWEQFNSFMDELTLTVRKVMKVDDIRKAISKQVIRPKKAIHSPDEMYYAKPSQPFFLSYYGMGDYIFYSVLWSGLLYDSNLFVNNFDLVDEAGNGIVNIGDGGVYSGESNVFGEQDDFSMPDSGDIKIYDDTLPNEDIGETIEGLGSDEVSGDLDFDMGDPDL